MIRWGAVAAVLAFALTSCASTAQADEPVKVVVVGDSITAISFPARAEQFAAGEIDTGSWVHRLGDGYDVVGGWAVPGAHTADMRAGVDPTLEADVLVILAGTNDLYFGDPIEQTQLNLIAIARTVDAPRVVLSAIPPMDPRPADPPRWNAAMHDFAEEQGWAWIDPIEPLRRGERYAADLSEDGLHPNTAGQYELGEAMRAELDRVLG